MNMNKSEKKQEEQKKKKAKEKKVKGSRKVTQRQKIKELNEEITKLKSELTALNDKYLRVIAEFDNYKKRKNRETVNIVESATRDVFLELLPVIDDFERSLNSEPKQKDYRSLKEGILLIYKKLVAVLKKFGLEPIEAIDHPFDPELHEALMQVEVKEKDSNIIVEEVEKGYRIKDNVIRHSKVIVNK